MTVSPTPAPGAPPDPVTGLNTALAAEHAAVYAYGIAGARLTGAQRATATEAFNAHRARRDRLRALVLRYGGVPAEPEPAYTTPFPVVSGADCVRLAALVEERVAGAYLELAAVPDPGLRRMAAQAIQECAVRGYGWRPSPSAFPGFPAPAAGATATPSSAATP